MTPRPRRLPGAAGGRRWPLMPLLVLRAHEEQRVLRALGRALAEARSAAEDEAARWTTLACASPEAPELASSAADFARGERFAVKLRQELSEAARSAARARRAAEEACAAYARARGAREGLEAEEKRWVLRRRRAREAVLEHHLEDLLVFAQASPGAPDAAALVPMRPTRAR